LRKSLLSLDGRGRGEGEIEIFGNGYTVPKLGGER
jgi:hypothetical protein